MRYFCGCLVWFDFDLSKGENGGLTLSATDLGFTCLQSRENCDCAFTKSPRNFLDRFHQFFVKFCLQCAPDFEKLWNAERNNPCYTLNSSHYLRIVPYERSWNLWNLKSATLVISIYMGRSDHLLAASFSVRAFVSYSVEFDPLEKNRFCGTFDLNETIVFNLESRSLASLSRWVNVFYLSCHLSVMFWNFFIW